jgi:predicted Zn-dependent protease
MVRIGGLVARSKACWGDIAVRRRQIDQALPLLQQALHLDPNLWVAHFNLGIVYTEQKRYAQALVALKRAVRLDPERAQAHFRLATAYRAMGRDVDAKAELAEVQRLQSKKHEDLLHKISGSPPVPPLE